MVFFFSSRRRHTILTCDWSSDVCSSDLSVERASPRRWPAHRLPSAPRASASTYWLRNRPHGREAVTAPLESVISAHVAPRSHDSLIPSAVPTYTVSPRVALPLGATYCHWGPSCLSS